jgi:hypothetical protein
LKDVTVSINFQQHCVEISVAIVHHVVHFYEHTSARIINNRLNKYISNDARKNFSLVELYRGSRWLETKIILIFVFIVAPLSMVDLASPYFFRTGYFFAAASSNTHCTRMSKNIQFTRKSKMSISAYTIKCFDEVKKNPQFRNKWITDVAWIEIIKDECSNIPKDKCIKTGSLNNGFSKQYPYKTHDLLKQNVTNATGVYKANNGKEYAYYVTEPNQLPDSLTNTGTWRGKWISSLKDLKDMTKRMPTRQYLKDNDSSEMKKKKRMPTTTIVSGRKKHRTTRNSLNTEEVATHFQQSMNYWNSGECLRVFGIARPSTDDANDDLKQVIQNRISIIRNAYHESAGWREVIDDKDSGNLYTEHDTFNLRWTCRYIVEALEIALEDRGKTSTDSWEACCKEAVLRINSLEKLN